MFLLTGCSGRFDEESEEALAYVEYDYKSEFIFPYWRTLERLNDDPIESDAHRAFIDVYVNDLAKTPYISTASSFPPGAFIVKPLYFDESRRSIARLVIMMKMEPGYDPKNNDWWYGVYDQNGMEGWYQGRIGSCIRCHSLAREHDFLFSEGVMESIREQKG